jgi:hypothetical protein
MVRTLEKHIRRHGIMEDGKLYAGLLTEIVKLLE